jgi:hypothetical protein
MASVIYQAKVILRETGPVLSLSLELSILGGVVRVERKSDWIELKIAMGVCLVTFRMGILQTPGALLRNIKVLARMFRRIRLTRRRMALEDFWRLPIME